MPQLFECSQCAESFKRREHLSRHLNSHNAEKPFSCKICHKSFTRRDTLARHITIHKPDSSDEGINLRSAVSRISQACTNCARSRLRCDGRKPQCGRCVAKDNVCAYRPGIRTRIKSVSPNQEPMAEAGSSREESRSQTLSLSNKTYQQTRGIDSDVELNPANSQAGGSNMTSDDPRFRVSSSSSLHEPLSFLDSVEGQCVDATVSTTRADFSKWKSVGTQPDHPTYLTEPSFEQTNFTFEAPLDPGFDLIDWMTDASPYFVEDYHRSSSRDPYSTLLEPVDPLDWNPTVAQTPDCSFGTMTPTELSESTPYSAKAMQMSKHGKGIVTLVDEDQSDATTNVSSNPTTHAQDKKAETRWPMNWEPEKSDNMISFPDLTDIPREIIDAENFPHVKNLDLQTYDQMVECLHETNLENSVYQPFSPSVFPPKTVINCFIQLYFEYFNPVYPLLHQATFDPTKTHWLLVLAVAATGCHYSQTNASSKCANALQELLRRAVALVCEKDNSNVRRIWMAQATLLNCLGMLYSGNRRLLELCMVFRSTSVTQSRRNGSLAQTPPCPFSINDSTDGTLLESMWRHWIKQEELRRFGFCTMIYDCQFPLYFGICPSMEFTELKQQLPCPEEMWEASNATEWKKCVLQQPQTPTQMSPSLMSTLQHLSSNTPIPKMGTFAKIVIIHAVHRHIWDMKQCEEMPLMPRFNVDQKLNWHTKVLDTLSSLEPAHGAPEHAIGSNLEVHIHLISLLLFLPIQEIYNFARSDVSPQEKQHARQRLTTWIQENNGQTARHAIVYASALFGKIRPRPSSAFYEPAAFLLATLTLWSFSQLSGSHSRSRPDDGSSVSRQQQMPTIRLDRMRADELREWIERGENVRGYLGDVGNINDSDTGNRILRVAVGHLGAMERWALAQGFVSVLSALLGRCEIGGDEV